MGRPPFVIPNLGTLAMSQQNFDMLKQTTVDLQGRLKEAEVSDAKKAQEITELRSQLGDRTTRFDALNRDFDAQKTQLTRLNTELGQQKAVATRLSRDLEAQKTEATTLAQTLAQERGVLQGVQNDLKLERTRFAEVQAALKRREAEIEALRAQQSAPDKAQSEVNSAQPIALSALARTIGEQATSARDDMSSKGMRISNLSVTLRALPTEDGSTLRLPGARALDNKSLSERLAEFKFDIEMLPSGERPETAGNKVSMPDLTGMTRGAAAQVMAALGLRLVDASGPSSRPRIVAGQAFRQQIKPGDPVDRGSEIIVVFATDSKE
jgi:chromosome segregation ATPase